MHISKTFAFGGHPFLRFVKYNSDLSSILRSLRYQETMIPKSLRLPIVPIISMLVVNKTSSTVSSTCHRSLLQVLLPRPSYTVIPFTRLLDPSRAAEMYNNGGSFNGLLENCLLQAYSHEHTTTSRAFSVLPIDNNSLRGFGKSYLYDHLTLLS